MENPLPHLEEAVEAEFLLMAVEGVKDGKDHVFAAGGFVDGRFTGRVARVTKERGREMCGQAEKMGLAFLLGEPVGAAVAAREV